MGRRLLGSAAEVAGVAAAALFKFGPTVAGVGLTSYGAWLAWRPAGFLVAGALILADQIAGRRAG